MVRLYTIFIVMVNVRKSNMVYYINLVGKDMTLPQVTTKNNPPEIARCGPSLTRKNMRY
jgi:hypothetical protein